MYVNEVAKSAGVKPHVVRYYTRIGLLQPSRSPDNGYKRYAERDLDRLARIQWLQTLGFSLSEIRNLLDRDLKAPSGCTALLTGLQRNIARNGRRIAELKTLQQRMEAAFEAWDMAQCCDRAAAEFESA